MWKKLRKNTVGDVYRYTNEYVQLDVRVVNEQEKLTFIYFPESNDIMFTKKATCGCHQTTNENCLLKLVKRRPYRELNPEEKFEMLKTAFSELLHIESAFTQVYKRDGELAYDCKQCSCSRCGDYLERCACRCESDHLMKECSCTCKECHEKLTVCECWCDMCGYPVHSLEHELHCEEWADDDCGCCPCCGCTCDDYDEDTFYEEHDEEDYDDEDENEKEQRSE